MRHGNIPCQSLTHGAARLLQQLRHGRRAARPRCRFGHGVRQRQGLRWSAAGRTAGAGNCTTSSRPTRPACSIATPYTGTRCRTPSPTASASPPCFLQVAAQRFSCRSSCCGRGAPRLAHQPVRPPPACDAAPPLTKPTRALHTLTQQKTGCARYTGPRYSLLLQPSQQGARRGSAHIQLAAAAADGPPPRHPGGPSLPQAAARSLGRWRHECNLPAGVAKLHHNALEPAGL